MLNGDEHVATTMQRLFMSWSHSALPFAVRDRSEIFYFSLAFPQPAFASANLPHEAHTSPSRAAQGRNRREHVRDSHSRRW